MFMSFKFQKAVFWWKRSVLRPDLASERCLFMWNSCENGSEWNFLFVKCREVPIHNSCNIILGRVFDEPYCRFGMNIGIIHCYTPSPHWGTRTLRGRNEILALIKGDFMSEIEGTRWNPFPELIQLKYTLTASPLTGCELWQLDGIAVWAC